MTNSIGPTEPHRRRVTRRQVLQAGGGGAAGLAGILATGKPRAFAQTRELTVLTVASFVPDTGKELGRQFEEWGPGTR